MRLAARNPAHECRRRRAAAGSAPARPAPRPPDRPPRRRPAGPEEARGAAPEPHPRSMTRRPAAPASPPGPGAAGMPPPPLRRRGRRPGRKPRRDTSPRRSGPRPRCPTAKARHSARGRSRARRRWRRPGYGHAGRCAGWPARSPAPGPGAAEPPPAGRSSGRSRRPLRWPPLQTEPARRASAAPRPALHEVHLRGARIHEARVHTRVHQGLHQCPRPDHAAPPALRMRFPGLSL